MQINHRTLLAHLAVFVLLIAVLFAIRDAAEIFRWMIRNAVILGFWTVVVIALGVMADRFARHRTLQKIQLALISRMDGTDPRRLYRNFKKNGKGIRCRVLFLWAGCSRCLAWWSGAVASFLIHVFYWPRWFGALYFAALGASLGAAIAVLLYLARRRKIELKKAAI